MRDRITLLNQAFSQPQSLVKCIVPKLNGSGSLTESAA